MLIVREHGPNRKYVTRNYTPKNYNHRIHDNEIFLSINTPAIQTSPHAVFFEKRMKNQVTKSNVAI